MARKGLLLFTLCGAFAWAQTPAPSSLFDQDAVHTIHLRFANSDWFQVLTDNYDGVKADNPYFTASFDWGGYHFDSVGVRFKGNASYRAGQKKNPFRIKLNAFVKGQKIDVLDSLTLSNGWNDPSMVREPVYYEIARAMGIKAARTNYAALYVNDEYWGLYVLGEVVNAEFLKMHFGKSDDTGNLYKANVGSTFQYPGEDKASYQNSWEKQSNEEADDWSDLIALCKLINETPAESLRAALEPIMDVDSVLAALALDNATLNLDNYIGNSCNFYIYRRPSDNRWVWIPWDPSLAFGAFGQGGSGSSLLTLALEWTGSGSSTQGGRGGAVASTGSSRPLATKLFAVSEYQERYRLIYRQLVDKFFLADTTLARMTALQTMIRPWLELDPNKLATLAQFEASLSSTATASTQTGGGLGGQGGASGSSLGLKALVEGRLTSIQTLLGSTAITPVMLAPNVSSIAFSAKAGKSADAQKLTVGVSGETSPASFTLTSTTDSGGSWLTIPVATGIAGATVEIGASAADLAAGVYTGTIAVHMTSAPNNPLYLPVTFTVN
jgi:spore coat protein CotH